MNFHENMIRNSVFRSLVFCCLIFFNSQSLDSLLLGETMNESDDINLVVVVSKDNESETNDKTKTKAISISNIDILISPATYTTAELSSSPILTSSSPSSTTITPTTTASAIQLPAMPQRKLTPPLKIILPTTTTANFLPVLKNSLIPVKPPSAASVINQRKLSAIEIDWPKLRRVIIFKNGLIFLNGLLFFY